MVEIDCGQGSKPPPQISDMFQRFALAFKTKTYDLFAEDTPVDGDGDVLALLDSAEEFIPDQKVVVIKPDHSGDDNLLRRVVVPSLFATVSAFEASYLQLQAAHVPRIDQNALKQADESLVSILQKLAELKSFYNRPGSNRRRSDFPATSYLEFQVQENQSKLRALETIANSLQSQIDAKDEELNARRKELDQIKASYTELSRRAAAPTVVEQRFLTIGVFSAMVGDAVKSLRCFTKLLIDLMHKAGWDLENVSNYIHPDINYAKNGHCRYAYLSYVCMRMFQNFDKKDFGLSDAQTAVDSYWQQLVDHISKDPNSNPNKSFLQFCQRKYEVLIHPTMESSIFSNLDRKDKVLESWKSLSVFFESFVRMASSVWVLHKLSNSFDPAVEIFVVAKGSSFSTVYTEDVSTKSNVGKGTSVGFTVVPGFKFGGTVIQSQVYFCV
ncbi:protein GRAVITROPIC IN THE LIGHT 1-like [Andrographis paniculata]|uniref:protein GRAVITROPIC IN THE LIGHT 1-like n=1 Tax=Andrographis paniculata TaxID=175694 RepID=UPI0021E75C6D|nr:protein GRAVITROPIC IN THE LIGHT 1-like [Andrographis paniculata]